MEHVDTFWRIPSWTHRLLVVSTLVLGWNTVPSSAKRPQSSNWLFCRNCACWVCLCFHNPPNSDMDYTIFHVCMWSFCLRIHSGPRFMVSSEGLLWGVALFWLRGNCPQSARKACRETVTLPCGDHARSCCTTAFESDCAGCVPRALPKRSEF